MIRPNAYEATGEYISQGIALSVGAHPDFEYAVTLGLPAEEQIWVPVSSDEPPLIRKGLLVTGHLVDIEPVDENCATKMIVNTENIVDGTVLIKMNMHLAGIAGRGLFLVPSVNNGSSKFDVLHTTGVVPVAGQHAKFSHHTILHELGLNDSIVGDIAKQHPLPGYEGKLPDMPAITNLNGVPSLTTAIRFHRAIKSAAKTRAQAARVERRTAES